jgi:hypothetical protein
MSDTNIEGEEKKKIQKKGTNNNLSTKTENVASKRMTRRIE